MVAASNLNNHSRSEFLEWARSVAEPRSQHPIDEMLAEHHLMRVVLLAMQREALRVQNKREFRMEFWAGAVDFVGNFGLLYHWRKKANHLYPALEELGRAEGIKRLEDQQTRDIDLTLDFTDAVQECDFEHLTRIVALLVLVKREKMDAEEREILHPARTALGASTIEALRTAFDQVERKSLPERGRREYLDIARKLSDLTGLGDPTDA